MIAALNDAREYLPRVKATTVRAAKAKSIAPPASPSKPSVSLPEKALAVMINIKNGT